ncbi:MAG: hypothetical protein QHH09_03435 [Microgenomates group bacterium]|nr:hypothetical protein [Microgenomates group bacterium]
MPKKTKKEKIIAEYRKRLKLLRLTKIVPEKAPSPEIQIEKSFTNLVKEPEPKKQINLNIDTSEDDKIKIFFLNDFKKSLFLTTLIIALEIIFYFVSIKNNFGLN